MDLKALLDALPYLYVQLLYLEYYKKNLYSGLVRHFVIFLDSLWLSWLKRDVGIQGLDT